MWASSRPLLPWLGVLGGLNPPSHSLNRWREGQGRDWLSRRKYLLCAVIKFQGHGSIHEVWNCKKQKVVRGPGCHILLMKGETPGSESLSDQHILLTFLLADVNRAAGRDEPWEWDTERSCDARSFCVLIATDAWEVLHPALTRCCLHCSEPQGPIHKGEKRSVPSRGT